MSDNKRLSDAEIEKLTDRCVEQFTEMDAEYAAEAKSPPVAVAAELPEAIAWGVPNSRPTERSPLMTVTLDNTGAQYPELLIPLIDRTAAEQIIAAKEAQLPDCMKHCTILFKECAKGHGWLTATNWVQHDCPTCTIAAKEAEIARKDAEIQLARDFILNQSDGNLGYGDQPVQFICSCLALKINQCKALEAGQKSAEQRAESAESRLAVVEAALATKSEDAARYRWLRERWGKHFGSANITWTLPLGTSLMDNEEEFDKSIDAAIRSLGDKE